MQYIHDQLYFTNHTKNRVDVDLNKYAVATAFAESANIPLAVADAIAVEVAFILATENNAMVEVANNFAFANNEVATVANDTPTA